MRFLEDRNCCEDDGAGREVSSVICEYNYSGKEVFLCL